MKNVIEHLKECGVGIFQINEINEPLMIMYKILSWAVKSESDTLVIYTNFVVWQKNDLEVDRWQPQKLIPVLGFPVLLEKIIARDQIVKDILELISENNEKKVYKILY